MFHEILSKALVAIILLLPSARTATADEPAANVTVPAVYSSPDGAILHTPPVPIQSNGAKSFSGVQQISFQIFVVEDRQGCLKEFESFSKGAPVEIVDTHTLLPMLRILEKHSLVQELASPTIVALVGHPAEFEFTHDRTAEEKPVSIKISGELFDKSAKVDVAVTIHRDSPSTEQKVETSVFLGPGSSTILHACGPRLDNEFVDGDSKLYVIVTPEIAH